MREEDTELPNAVVWQDISRETRMKTTQITESNLRNWRPFKCGKGRCKGLCGPEESVLFLQEHVVKVVTKWVCIFAKKWLLNLRKKGHASHTAWGGSGASAEFALHSCRLLWQGPSIPALIRHCPCLDLAERVFTLSAAVWAMQLLKCRVFVKRHCCLTQ